MIICLIYELGYNFTSGIFSLSEKACPALCMLPLSFISLSCLWGKWNHCILSHMYTETESVVLKFVWFASARAITVSLFRVSPFVTAVITPLWSLCLVTNSWMLLAISYLAKWFPEGYKITGFPSEINNPLVCIWELSHPKELSISTLMPL